MLLSIPPRPSTRTRLIPGLSLRAGDTLPGGYRTLSLLHADRACAHLAALHTSSNQRVDVQVLLAMDDSIEAVHLRFLADGRKAAALQSPNVERVLHVGVTQDGHPFVVCERASGEPLATLLTRMGSLPTEHAVDIAVAICRALETAHAVGLLHAELDPTMVRLDWTAAGPSNVKVSGLGTSRALALLPTEGRSFMSLALRAPELLSIESVDARVDIWGVGVLLYTMLAGELPFAAESPSKMDVSSTGDEPALLAGVPDGLGEIVDACLSRDPAMRPQSAASLAARLTLFGSHPVFEKRTAELVVDTGPYEVIELERALRAARAAEPEVVKEPSDAPSVAGSADKTPVPVTVATTMSSPPVAMTVTPATSSLRATLAQPGPRPQRHWRTAGLVAAACMTAGVVAIAVSLQASDAPVAPVGRAAAITVAPPPPVAPEAPALTVPVVEVKPAAPAAPAAVTMTPTPLARPRPAPAAADPIVRPASAPPQPQPKASEDDLRRFLDDRR
jgi:serine/threonine protein kinase